MPAKGDKRLPPVPALDRRGSARHPARIAGHIQAEDGDQLAIVRDLSVTGSLALTRARLELNEHVQLVLAMPDGGERRVSGKVIRADATEGASADLWPHRVALHFDRPLSESDPVLELTDAQALLLVVKK